MGSEIIFPIGVGLGLALFGWLSFRTFNARTRPYALPTLVAALAFAFALNDGHGPGYYWYYLVDWFCLGAIIFGLHAHAIGGLPFDMPNAQPNNRFERSRGGGFDEPRRGSMIWINQLRLTSTQPHVAQPHR